jgi:hypothetical protein
MTDNKVKAYKMSLKSPYTGMTEELLNKIEGMDINTDVIDMDLNRDGKFDKTDLTIAGKVLQKNKQKVR